MNLKREFIGEFLGTFVLVIFGCGAVAVSVLFNAHQGLFQIAILWGIGVTLAIYTTRHLSYAHLNPAVTLAMVTSHRMQLKKLPVYLLAQFLGAFFAGLALYLFFNPSIVAYENIHHIIRGTADSMNTAKIFGEYYQLPGSNAVVSMPIALLAEAFGTFLLISFIFFLTEDSNGGRPNSNTAPIFIGLSVTSIICLIAPLTQAGLNPARDFSPRMVTWIFGWNNAAFPDYNGGFFWVYILAPIIGGQFAGLMFTKIIEPLMRDHAIENNTNERRDNMNTRIILVGGFLGAGKTTLLWESARKLTEQGKRVGLITNDQASHLVDTAFLERSGSTVSEVNGSCFCCNFNGFSDALFNIKDKIKADIIIAEPVGSCTDLSATIMQPLKENFTDKLAISPLTVLVDPERLKTLLEGGISELHASAAYIVEKQLEEADIIVITKADLLSPYQLESLQRQAADRWPLAKILTMNYKNGVSMESWLNEVMNYFTAGTHLAEIDYDVYAEGEAVLGWLNTTVLLRGKSVSWDLLAEKILTELSHRFDSVNAAVGHVKLLIESGNHYIVGNLTGGKSASNIRGYAGISNEANLILNARVEMTPANLENIVSEVLCKVCGDDIYQNVEASKCLSPGRPNPTHRYAYVVA